jgi:phenylacetate-CoA ligase
MTIFDPEIECAPSEIRDRWRLKKLREGLNRVAASNPFYRRKWREAGVSVQDVRQLADIALLPLTEKAEFLADQAENPIYGTNLTEPLTNYRRYHQTTGTTGQPLKWLDSEEGWKWRTRCAAMAMVAAGVTKHDTILFPFSFSPHSAFWGLFDGGQLIGALVIAGGGWSTEQRINSIIENEVTVLACTPTYALHMAQVALVNGHDLSKSSIRILLHSGEPGALVAHVRKRIEEAFGARPFDYLGMTEVGAHSFLCEARVDALHMIESEFIAEVIDPATNLVLPEGQMGELVLTNLGRWASPAIRFRTGDMVVLKSGCCDCGRTYSILEGGVLGRRDQMIIIRGINVFPEMIGELVGPLLKEGEEWQVVLENNGGQDSVTVNLELHCTGEKAEDIIKEATHRCKLNLELTVKVSAVSSGSIDRRGAKIMRLKDMRVM